MSRFVHHTDDDLLDFCLKKNAKDRATNFGVKLLRMFFIESGQEGNIDTLFPEDLNDLLARFYAGVRTTKGELYKLNSMRSMRFSIQRYFLAVSGVDILTNTAF